MEGRIIARGCLAGAVGGLLSIVFARIFVTPVIDRAIEYEEGRAEAAGASGHGIEMFTRGVQANVGMSVGVLAFSVAMGALFAVVFCVVHGRVDHLSPRLLSVLLAGAMFVAVYLVPALKYPKNPPAVGREETLQQRSLLFLFMVVASAALIVCAVWWGRRLTRRFGAWSATLMAMGSYAVAVAIVMLVLPTFDETPEPLRVGGTTVFPGFAADDLYEFRLYSLGTQLILWTSIALVFAPLVARLLGEATRGPGWLGGKRESAAPCE